MADPIIRITFPRTARVTATTDHGAMTGLGDDDHPQYHNDARGDARYPLKTNGTMTGATLTSVQTLSMLFPDGSVHRIVPVKSGSVYTLEVEQTAS